MREDVIFSMYNTYNDPLLLKDRAVTVPELFRHNLLHTNSILNINQEARILSLLQVQPPEILAQQRFTKNEWALLITLLENYPHYAPHEFLLASITCLSPSECRQRFQQAQKFNSTAVKQELKPVYRALSGVRAKLGKLCPYLKISPVRETGYILTVSHHQDFFLEEEAKN